MDTIERYVYVEENEEKKKQKEQWYEDLLVTGGNGISINFFNLQTNKHVKKFNRTSLSRWINGIIRSRVDDSNILVSSSDGKTYEFSMKDQKMTGREYDSKMSKSRTIISHGKNGTFIVGGEGSSYGKKGGIRIWREGRTTQSHSFGYEDTKNQDIHLLHFSKSLDRLISVHNHDGNYGSHSVDFWDIKEGKNKKTDSFLTTRIEGLEYAEDKNVLFICGERLLTIYGNNTGWKELSNIRHRLGVCKCLYLYDQHKIITGSWRDISIFDIRKIRLGQIKDTEDSEPLFFKKDVFSSNCTNIKRINATCFATTARDGSVKVFNIANGKLMKSMSEERNKAVFGMLYLGERYGYSSEEMKRKMEMMKSDLEERIRFLKDEVFLMMDDVDGSELFLKVFVARSSEFCLPKWIL